MKAYYAFTILVQLVAAALLKDSARLAFLRHLLGTIMTGRLISQPEY